MSRGELQAARETLHEMRMQLARYGSDAPPHMITGERAQAKRVGQLEEALGLPRTEPRVLPDARRSAPQPADAFDLEMERRRVKAVRDDIAHQVGLLDAYRRNLALLRATAEAHGGVVLAPVYVQNQMNEARAEIAERKRVLRDLYGRRVDDLAGDE